MDGAVVGATGAMLLRFQASGNNLEVASRGREACVCWIVENIYQTRLTLKNASKLEPRNAVGSAECLGTWKECDSSFKYQASECKNQAQLSFFDVFFLSANNSPTT